MAAAISLAEVPKPSGIDMQISQLVEARPKLEAAIAEQKDKLAEADVQLAKTFASSAQTAAKIDVEKALQSKNASEESKARIQQRIEALESILEKVSAYLEQLKADYPEAVSAALHVRLNTLEAARSEKEVAEEHLTEEIKKLKTEISKLPKSAKKAAVKY